MRETQALVLAEHHEDAAAAIKALRLETRELRAPRRGEVLVEISAAPCNPSDLLLLQGKYGVGKTLPTVPGWEGCGRVIETGAGAVSSMLRGRRVALIAPPDGDGTWAAHCVTKAAYCLPLPENLSDEQGATSVINPMTALGLLEIAKRCRATAVLQTAAFSQLGKMLSRLCKQSRIAMLHVVHRQEQAEALARAGELHVLNASDPDFREKLESTARRLHVAVAYDAVGGEMTLTLLEALPPKGRVVLYGALSQAPVPELDPITVIFEEKKLEGFYLKGWLDAKPLPQRMWLARRAQRLIRQGTLATEVAERVSLEEAPAALERYQTQMGRGKVLLFPNRH